MQVAMQTAVRMCAVARTAPKGHGKNIFFDQGIFYT